MAREFFSVRSVHEALREFRPKRRTAIEEISLTQAAGRVLATDLRSPGPLPGFARASVDGYAVRAKDTHGASEGLPSYLELRGAVRMGVADAPQVEPGTAVSVPTGGTLPSGADAVLMVEHAAESIPGTIEALRPVAVGDGVVGADEDVKTGDVLATAGRVLRANDLGLLAAAGLSVIPVRARPRVAIISTGDEVVPPETRSLLPGQVRDAIAPALAALVTEAGGIAEPLGIVPDDAETLRRTLERALAHADLVTISAGSSVGARDFTAQVVASLGEPGIWCHGLALKPGKPTLLAECGGVPILGLPGNPLSALVVFRLIGLPLLHLLAGCTAPPPTARSRGELSRDLPSAPGRLDVVQVRLRDGLVEPLFGKSALLSTLAAADGYVLVPPEASGLFAGTEVEVELYR